MHPSRCSNCGENTLSERTVPFAVRHNGISREIADRQTYCEHCGNISYIGSQMPEHDIAVAAAIREIDELLSPSELRRIREKYRLKQTDMEQILGTGAKTWTRWERGKITQTKAVDTLVRLLDQNPRHMFRLIRERGVINQAADDMFVRMQSGYRMGINNVLEDFNRNRDSLGYSYRFEISATTPERIRSPETANA